MEDTYIKSTNKTLAQTFLWMFLGVLSTAIVAAYTYYSGVVYEVVGAWYAILIGQLLIALFFNLCLRKLPTGVATCLFFVYSMLTRSNFFCNICSI